MPVKKVSLAPVYDYHAARVSVWRHAMQMIWCTIFHHFVTNLLFVPWTFKIVQKLQPALCSSASSTSSSSSLLSIYFLKFANLLYRYSPRLESNGTDVCHDALFFAVGITLVHLVAYVSINGVFFALDHFKLLSDYKIPRQQPQHTISNSLVVNTISKTLFSMVTMFPVLIAVYAFLPNYKQPIRSVDDALIWPADWNVLQQWLFFCACNVVNHILFWIVHATMHINETLYKFHQKHHQYKDTISIAAERCDVLENTLCNAIPTAFVAVSLGRFVPQSALLTYLFWRLLEAAENHGNYDFREMWITEIGIMQGEAHNHSKHHSCGGGVSSLVGHVRYGMVAIDGLAGTMGDPEYLKDARECPYQERKRKQQ